MADPYTSGTRKKNNTEVRVLQPECLLMHKDIVSLSAKCFRVLRVANERLHGSIEIRSLTLYTNPDNFLG